MHDDIKVLTHCSRCKNTDFGLIYTPATTADRAPSNAYRRARDGR